MPVPVIARIPGPPSEAWNEACACWTPSCWARNRAVPLTVSPGPKVRGGVAPPSVAVRFELPVRVSASIETGALLMFVTVNDCVDSAASFSSPKSSVSGWTTSSLSTPLPVRLICRGEQVGQGVTEMVELKLASRSGRNCSRTIIDWSAGIACSPPGATENTAGSWGGAMAIPVSAWPSSFVTSRSCVAVSFTTTGPKSNESPESVASPRTALPRRSTSAPLLAGESVAIRSMRSYAPSWGGR